MRCFYINSLAAPLMFLFGFIGVANANPMKTITAIPSSSDGSLNLIIVHTNDMHARFEQTSRLSGTCSETEAASNSCYGGFARVATMVRKARNGSTPALFLNAGDTYQGTVWFTVYKWRIVAEFLSLLEPDAISLGNHEFDNGVDGLIPFINNVTFPVLASNLNLTNEPILAATNLTKSTVIEVDGVKVGVIGYLTPETEILADSGKVIFEDEVEAIDKEAERLKESGVNILIALGHSGFAMDKQIAAEVEDIDLVIGGHTNTFLFDGDQPDIETPTGFYPTAVKQSSGRTVYVVQAYAYTKYLGNLSVTFDSQGELTHIEGNPILLDSSVEQATDILAHLAEWSDGIVNLTKTIVGSTRVLLDGDIGCRRRECNLGNLITDAFIEYNSKQYTGSDGWTDVAIAVVNGGSIRSSISTVNNNQITMADVLSVLPFGNVGVTVPMTGADILKMLEWSVYSLNPNFSDDLKGAFLQYSGIQVLYNLEQPPNSKVVSVKVRCANCTVPVFSDLDESATYNVMIPDYIYTGGDGFEFPQTGKTTIDATLADIVVDYLGRRSPVYPAVEWRITFQTKEPEQETPVDGGASYATYSIVMIVLPLILRILT